MGTHLHRPAMFTLAAILSLLVGVATSAPQARIIPEANTYGTQANTHFIQQRLKSKMSCTGNRHGADPGLPDHPVRVRQCPRRAQLPQHRAAVDQHLRGCHRHQRADCCDQHGHLWVLRRSLWLPGTQLWARSWPAVLLGLGFEQESIIEEGLPKHNQCISILERFKDEINY